MNDTTQSPTTQPATSQPPTPPETAAVKLGTFVDSGPTLGGEATLRERLRSDGYLFFRGLIEPGAVLEVRQQILEALGRCGWLADDVPAEEARPGEVVRHEASDEFWEGYAKVQGLESFHRLAHHPALLGAVRQALGSDAFAHPQKVARASFPGTGFVTQPHQDFRYIQGTADVVTAWIPLGACPQASGGLRVQVGSHRQGLLPVSPAPGAGGLMVHVDDDAPGWATIDYEPGDVVMFHSLTVHAALPNLSDRLRLSVDYRFQSAGEPIAGPSLTPHFEFRVPSWTDLSATWDSTDWFATPPELDVTDFTWPPSGDLPVPPSALLPT